MVVHALSNLSLSIGSLFMLFDTYQCDMKVTFSTRVTFCCLDFFAQSVKVTLSLINLSYENNRKI